MGFGDRFTITFEQYDETARAQGWIPFKLRVTRDGDSSGALCSFGVWFAEVQWGYETLRKDIGSALDRAAIRWAVAQVEERVRHNDLPETRTIEVQELLMNQAEFARVKVMARSKTCAYQMASGRDMFCSAAARDDATAVGSSGLRRLAPTSEPSCFECELPDTDFLCSHLKHPQVQGSQTLNDYRRMLVSALCDLDRPEIRNKNCHAGGNQCWTRIVEPTIEAPPAVPFSPRDLPVALDFLDAVWERLFKHRLLGRLTTEKTAAIVLPCATKEEFDSRLGDLNELFKRMNIPDDDLPEEKRAQIHEQATFVRMQSCLDAKIEDEADREKVKNGIERLRAINTVRNKLTHGGSELTNALNRLGIEYPITDYSKAWDSIRSKAAEALTTIRKVIENVSEDS